MAEPTKLSVKNEKTTAAPIQWTPFESLRREIDQLFDDFGGGFWRTPFRRSASDMVPSWDRDVAWATVPAVDISDTEKAYEITAELPGIDEKNIDVHLANGVLTISGEKHAETEDKDRLFSERYYGRFVRRIPLEDVDENKVTASFKKGVLIVTLPKSAVAVDRVKRIQIQSK